MRLTQLLQDLEIVKSWGDLSTEILGITHDSREIKPGYLFVAIKGEHFDGHDFIDQAVDKGAVALVGEDEAKLSSSQLPYILVPSSRKALAEMSARFYNHPSRKLKLIGVTGTNGKGLTCHLLYHIYKTAGRKVAYMGSLGAWLNDEPLPWPNKTTPEAPLIQETLAQIVQKDGDVVVMEVSSHAIAQYRSRGCEFDFGVFTNLSQDHLDYHKDMESYFKTKLKLFSDYPLYSSKPFTAVLNIDDPYGKLILKEINTSTITYGTSSQATIRGYLVEQDFSSLLFRLITPKGETDIHLPLGGSFNFHNALAASATAFADNIPLETIKKGLESSTPLPGRFETIEEGQDFWVIVDYAHTPQGLEQLLTSVAPLCKGRKIILFGCGGDRDRSKRPLMGRIASSLADLVIITSDNPRSEEPERIIEEILSGIPQERISTIIVEKDREKAIGLAIKMAEKDDCLLIAGKGHETYQIFADRIVHFDDREVARKFIKEKLNGTLS